MTAFVAALLSPAVGFSLAYWVAVWWHVHGFFGRRRYVPAASPASVSVLKPVKGVDPDAYDNFASFCRQHYPDYEILFGVADPDDPAVAVIERLRTDFPQCKIRIIQTSGPPTPPRCVRGSDGKRGSDFCNPKSASLHELADRAAGDLLVISDADIRAAPDYLRRVTAPLQDPKVGAVTCPYASLPADVLPSRLGALYLDGEFLPSAIFAHEALGVRVGLGATIAVRRTDLTRAGGYAAVADFLADDYHIVARIARLGYHVVLSRCAVTHVLGETDFRGQWDQEVRWALAVRSCNPWGYLRARPDLRHATGAGPGGGDGLFSRRAGPGRGGGGRAGPVGMADASVPVRRQGAAVAGVAAGARVVEPAGLGGRAVRTPRRVARPAFGPPARRAVGAEWMSEQVVKERRGGSRPVTGGLTPRRSFRPLAAPVRLLDRCLRRLFHIEEYSRSVDCMFRVALTPAPEDLRLADGTHVRRGEPIGELHYCNEHVPSLAEGQPAVAWAIAADHVVKHSLQELAAFAGANPSFRGARAFGGLMTGLSPQGESVLAKMGRRYGFETGLVEPPRTWLGRLHRGGEDVLICQLAWAYNPTSLRGAAPARRRCWISRKALLARYSPDGRGY
jgi:ceramide glucosyltransferase